MLISYLSIDVLITNANFEALKRLIPGSFITKNDRFHKFQDRQRNLFGLLLLMRSWHNLFDESLNLENIKTSKFNRPYLPNSLVDFNISHSGDFVVCVLSADSRVGIDIEQKKDVDLKDFTRTMNSDQWTEIHTSNNPLDTFFKYWSMKESVIKADGRGLSIPLTEIILDKDRVSYDGNLWHLYPFKIDASHNGCVASNNKINDLQLVKVHWKEFLK